MRFLSPQRRRPTLALLLFLSACTASCFATPPANGPGNAANKPAVAAVSNEQFAESLTRVLADGGRSPERAPLLAGVVRRQLAHARERFERNHEARATESVLGGLQLLRTGEAVGGIVDDAGEKALAGAIRRVSQRGDEGRAEALLRVRAAVLAPGSAAKLEVEEHLRALHDWISDTHGQQGLLRLGAEERAAVARALLDPSDEAQAAAVSAVDSWIGGALDFFNNPRRDDDTVSETVQALQAGEAMRAIEWGGATMATLFLRHGDARGAVTNIDQTVARKVTHPAFYARIRAAAATDEASDWEALVASYRDPLAGFVQWAQDEGRPRTPADHQVLGAGLWGTTLEAYRRDRADVEIAALLGHLLVRRGMPEGAAPVMTPALQATLDRSEARSPIGVANSVTMLSAAMEISLSALVESSALDGIEAARRTFQGMAPLVTLAERPEWEGHVGPSSARARFVMAGMEVRSGHLAEARPLLERALAAEPSVSGYTMLALVERQAGDGPAASAHVKRGVQAPDAAVAQADVAEAWILGYELARDAGDGSSANAALGTALSAALAARHPQQGAPERARAERILAHVLDVYGDARGAARAFERGFVSAASDRSALGTTMLYAIGRALVRRDLALARTALKRGVDGDVSDDDLVYGGLWLWLLERELHAAPDGTVERALRPGPHGAWTGRLCSWTSGKVSDAELTASAREAGQRIEAAFYTAMMRRMAGDPAAMDRLREVARSPSIDLMEVQIAREIVAPPLPTTLPAGVSLP